jgi:BirA family transcriptional regulator, biotin operon repressor / biotin---[acetyl-CoA-carboxylase] ligase
LVDPCACQHERRCRKGVVLTATIRTVAETASTNADLLALAASGTHDGLWLRAERQTAGRGRLGREWTSPPGNLYVSTIVQLRPGDPSAATLGFVVAVALDEVLRAYAPDVAFQIKWPNDVLASGAKLSGVLLERSGDAIVVGIGVNLASHPDLPDRPTTSLAALTGSAADPKAFLEDVVEAFARWLGIWRSAGLGAILDRWRARAHPIGTALKVNLPDQNVLEGLYDGLSEEGALKLRLADGAVRAIHAGDVFLV